MPTKDIYWIFILLLILSSWGCSSEVTEPAPTKVITESTTIDLPDPSPTATDPPNEVKPTPTHRPISPVEEGSFITFGNDYFTTAGICVACHNNNIVRSFKPWPKFDPWL